MKPEGGAAVGSATPSTSMAVASGAAATIASSIRFLRVSADEGHPLQLPCIRSRTTPLVDADQFDLAPVRAEERTHRFECLSHSRFQVEGMQPVEHQQAADQVVPGHGVQERAARLAGLAQLVTDPSEARTVQVEDGLDQLLALARVAGSADFSIHWISVSIRSIRCRNSLSEVGSTITSPLELGFRRGSRCDTRTIPDATDGITRCK